VALPGESAQPFWPSISALELQVALIGFATLSSGIETVRLYGIVFAKFAGAGFTLTSAPPVERALTLNPVLQLTVACLVTLPLAARLGSPNDPELRLQVGLMLPTAFTVRVCAAAGPPADVIASTAQTAVRARFGALSLMLENPRSRLAPRRIG
jgi:hypothetical protein